MPLQIKRLGRENLVSNNRIVQKYWTYETFIHYTSLQLKEIGEILRNAIMKDVVPWPPLAANASEDIWRRHLKMTKALVGEYNFSVYYQ